MQKIGLGRAALLLAAVAAALCFVGPARAEWAPRVEWRVANAVAPSSSLAGEVLVNGQIVLRLRSELGGVLPAQRAEVAAERLKAAVMAGLRPADVRVDAATEKEFPRLKAGGQTIAVATQNEVEASGRTVAASPLALARSWSAALRAALAVPPITVTTPAGGGISGSERLVVPIGENRVLRLGGAARGPVEIATASGEAKVVRASVDPYTSEVMLSGAGLGSETITLRLE